MRNSPVRRSAQEQGEVVRLGCKWGSRSREWYGLENCSEGEGFYGCIRGVGGISISEHLEHEVFLPLSLQCEEHQTEDTVE